MGAFDCIALAFVAVILPFAILIAALWAFAIFAVTFLGALGAVHYAIDRGCNAWRAWRAQRRRVLA